MRVAQLAAYGEPLQVVDEPVTEPGPARVRVRMAAATVNPADWLVAGGVLAAMTPHLSPPLVLGWDLVGEVTAVGAGVELQPGQQVVALVPWFETGEGTFAEEVVLDAALVVPLPPGLDPAQAATIPLNGQTAHQALDLLGPVAGKRVLVTGASGGVGGFAVQLARAAGADVVAVASAGDEDRVAALGAGHVLRRGDDLVDTVRGLAPGGVDAVLDTAPVGPQLIAAVADGGAFVTVLDPTIPEAERGITVAKVSVVPDGEQLSRLLSELAAGRLTTRVARQMPLADAAEAMALASGGGLPGKVVLVP